MSQRNYYVPESSKRMGNKRRKRKNKNRLMAILCGVIIVLLLLLIILLVASMNSDTSVATPTPEPTAIATPIPTPEPTTIPTADPTVTPNTTTDIQVLSQLGLPIPDEKGKTSYTGQVGYKFNEDGSAIIESLFDQGVIEIEALDWVDDACVVVEGYNITIVIMANGALNDNTVKDIVDSAIRRLSSTLSMSSKYTSPSKDNYGSLYDDYFLTVGVFASGSQKEMARCTKAMLSNTLRWK